MLRIWFLRRLAIAAGAVFLSFSAHALEVAYIDASALNVRTGPGTGYAVITSLPRGTEVAVHGYTRSGGWCDISAGQLRGWASCRYLENGPGLDGPVTAWGPLVGVPIVVFSFGSYHDTHYRDRPWYRDRDWLRDRRDRSSRSERRDRDIERMLRAKEMSEHKTRCRLSGARIVCDD